jgi:hypothetical protein
MQYITNSNYSKLTDLTLNLRKIYVKRLNGEIHIYNKVLKSPAIHSNYNCSKLKNDYINSKNFIPNSGAAFVINYPIVQLTENSFDELDDSVSEYQNSLYFHAGFNICQFCAFVNNLDNTPISDYLTTEQWGKQYNEDMDYLKRYFDNHPDELDSWLGLD